MTNSKELFNELVGRITLPEEVSEIQHIVFLLLSHVYQLTYTEILAGKPIQVQDKSALNAMIDRINQHEPIQYITGEASFYGRIFQVNPAVLIPRPETELLVEAICVAARSNPEPKTILDIGTGSGCLAVSLALELPNTQVYAVDISQQALECAQKNARTLHASVTFQQLDILKEEISGTFDLIVSNPPYISQQEKSVMRKNVLDFEPHVALFAPGDDALLFYQTIAEKAKRALKPNGSLWFEINEHFGSEIADILKASGYNSIRLFQDLDKKDRMISARI
mgnify:CR=1 FL=1